MITIIERVAPIIVSNYFQEWDQTSQIPPPPANQFMVTQLTELQMYTQDLIPMVTE